MMPRIIVKALRKRNETGLARITHEGFYCNRRYVAATGLIVGGSPLGRSTDCFTYASLAAPGARLACCLTGFVMNPRE